MTESQRTSVLGRIISPKLVIGQSAFRLWRIFFKSYFFLLTTGRMNSVYVTSLANRISAISFSPLKSGLNIPWELMFSIGISTTGSAQNLSPEITLQSGFDSVNHSPRRTWVLKIYFINYHFISLWLYDSHFGESW